MHRIIFMAGTILASSLGFALAGLALRQAIKNSRSQRIGRRPVRPEPAQPDTAAAGWDTAVRGYDSPEVARDDHLARGRYSGSDRSAQ